VHIVTSDVSIVTDIAFVIKSTYFSNATSCRLVDVSQETPPSSSGQDSTPSPQLCHFQLLQFQTLLEMPCCNVKRSGVLVHAIKAWMRNRGMTPLFLNLVTGWKRVVMFPPPSLYPPGIDPLSRRMCRPQSRCFLKNTTCRETNPNLPSHSMASVRLWAWRTPAALTTFRPTGAAAAFGYRHENTYGQWRG